MSDAEQTIQEDVAPQARNVDPDQTRDDAKAGKPKPQPVELTPQQAQELSLKVEAALLTTERPMTAAKLGELLGDVGAKAIQGRGR